MPEVEASCTWDVFPLPQDQDQVSMKQMVSINNLDDLQMVYFWLESLVCIFKFNSHS